MLQINPNEIIRITRLLNNSLSIIDENVLYFKKKYHDDPKEIELLKIDDIEKLTNNIKNNTLFLNNIITELVEATGESVDNLLKNKYSLNYFENRLLTHYAKNLSGDATKDKLSAINLCYEKDDKLNNYCLKMNFVEYAEKYFHNFKPEEYGLDENTVITELLEVYDKRGASEAYSIIHAIEYNCPSNYSEYKFNPTKLINSTNYYDFNNKTIGNYQTNSEMININGYDYEIVQVLPKDCTKVEMLAYNFGKANIINTMRTLPNKYLELCSKGNANTITLTCATDAMNNAGEWSGYYKPTAFMRSNNSNITIDIHGSFNDNTFYTQDTLIHEMGHKFDDLIYDKSIVNWLFGNTTYTDNNSDWNTAYKKYNDVLTSISLGGYATYPNVNEFFGDAAVAYFKEPGILKTMCPEVYELINNMLDGEYGYSYSDKIVAILNAT